MARYIKGACTFGHINSLAQQAKGQYATLFYFTLKTTPGVFRVKKPEECQVVFMNNRTMFRYKTKSGNWSSQLTYTIKNNSYYFLDLASAEETFKQEVAFAELQLKADIKRSTDALAVLACL